MERKSEMKSRVKIPLIAVIIIGALLWGFYIIQEEFADYGMYQLISYRTHEISSLIPFLCILVSIGCAVYLLVRFIKKNSDTAEKVLLIVFGLCLVMQISYIKEQSNIMSTTAVCTVEEVNRNGGTIVVSIDNGDGTIALKCPMLVRGLVEQRQQYLISYTWHKNTPDEGKLNMIQRVGI